MLVITRKEKDSIIIEIGDETVEITVAEIGKQVRLGITAPKNYKIWRKEIYLTVENNKQAIEKSEPTHIRDVLSSLKIDSLPK